MNNILLANFGGKAVPAPAPFASPVLPGPVTLDGAASALVDEAVVDRLKREFTTISLCAGRIMLEGGLQEVQRPLVAQLLEMPTVERNKFLQTVLSLAGDVREGKVTAWPNYGTADELRIAQQSGRAGGVTQLTRYDFLTQIVEMGTGKSGASVYMDVERKEGDPMPWLVVKYGRDGVPPLATMSFHLDRHAEYDLRDADAFFDAMKEDGHEFQRCFGNVYSDFFMGLFMATFSGSWDGKLHRMKFSRRPRADRMGYTISGKVYELMDPTRQPFGPMLTAMLNYYSGLDVPEAPKNQIAWLYENLPEVVKSSAGNYREVINHLRADWSQYRESVPVLECSIVMTLNALRAPQNVPEFVRGFIPCTFTQALESCEEHRQYRGKEEGEGLASFLNDDAKQVGIDPLGTLAPLYSGIRRYDDILKEVVASGMRSVSVYMHGSRFEPAGLAKRYGLDFQVFSDKKNTPYPVRDFIYDGLDPTDHAEFRIIDVMPEFKSESGGNPMMAEWNAHAQIMKRVSKEKIDSCCVFSRLFTEKVGRGQWAVDAKSIVGSWEPATSVAFSFSGCRPHNGEYITWLERRAYGPSLRLAWLPLGDRSQCEQFVQWVELCVSSRICFANHLRTWAIPCGVLTFYSPPRTFTLGENVEVVDVIAMSADHLAKRLAPEVRSLHAETRTRSTAAVFGGEQAVQTKLLAPVANFEAAFGVRVKPKAPAKKEEPDALAALVKK